MPLVLAQDIYPLNTPNAITIYLFYDGVSVCVGPPGGQKSVLEPLELEFQVFLSYPLWILRTKFRSSAGERVLLAAQPAVSPVYLHII